jgi:imidazolonepropionase
LSTGAKFGLIPKLHSDQFNSIGGVDVAIKLNAISIDHLEVLKSNDIKKLKNKNIIATLLPGASYFLDVPYQPARELINNNVPVALATDFNPGSCMTENLQIIMSLASLKLKMSAEEIINAVTINAAYALFMQNKIGSIEKGKQADVLIFDFPSYKDLIYHFAVNQIENVFKKGKKLKI